MFDEIIQMVMSLPCHLCLLYCCICLANFNLNVFNFIHVSNTILILIMAGSLYIILTLHIKKALWENFLVVLWSTPYICECCCFLKEKKSIIYCLILGPLIFENAIMCSQVVHTYCPKRKSTLEYWRKTKVNN